MGQCAVHGIKYYSHGMKYYLNINTHTHARTHARTHTHIYVES